MYDYYELCKDLKILEKKGAEISCIGKSFCGLDLHMLKFGSGEKKVLFNGAHHGLEYITSKLLIKFCHHLLKNPYDNVSCYIIPMVNPDGVNIAVNGVCPDHPFYEQLMYWAQGEDFTKVWQSNARGVDLNHNYDALWERGKELEPSHGIHGPGPTRFSGFTKVSEPETQAMVAITEVIQPHISLSLHSQGKEIYWEFMGNHHPDAIRIVNLMSERSGYVPKTVSGMTSFSGYKDYVISKYGSLSFTVEVGEGKNPLDFFEVCDIYKDVFEILQVAIEA